jgi:hypothetical protein
MAAVKKLRRRTPEESFSRLWNSHEALVGLQFGVDRIVLAECIVIVLNRGQCPLTGVAARYTKDRSANFDIYLPLWLARHNKQVFGLLFLAGEFVMLWKWLR